MRGLGRPNFVGSLMRLRSLLGLSYAAVATALTNVGFGGKRGSNKHFQDLDLPAEAGNAFPFVHRISCSRFTKATYETRPRAV